MWRDFYSTSLPSSSLCKDPRRHLSGGYVWMLSILSIPFLATFCITRARKGATTFPDCPAVRVLGKMWVLPVSCTQARSGRWGQSRGCLSGTTGKEEQAHRGWWGGVVGVFTEQDFRSRASAPPRCCEQLRKWQSSPRPWSLTPKVCWPPTSLSCSPLRALKPDR